MSRIQDLMTFTESYDSRIKKFCEPLETTFGINQFYHSIVTYSGEWVWAYLNHEWTNYFFSEDLYHLCPFLYHPDNYKDGIIFPKETENRELQTLLETSQNRYNIHTRLVFVRKIPQGMENFVFGINSSDLYQCLKLYNEIPLINEFIRRYKEEFQRFYSDLDDYKVDLKSIKGPSFEKMKVEVFPQTFNHQQFLKEINYIIPQELTIRELEIMKELSKGLSSSMIAHQLSIAPKTVEHHLERIKEKLLCNSKPELVQKARELQAIGYYESFLPNIFQGG